MTHSVKNYAEALYKALHGKSEDERKGIIGRFMDLMSRQRISHLVPKVVEQFEKIHLKHAGKRKVAVASASPLTDSVRKEIEKILGGNIELTEKVVPELVAGLTITVDDSIFIDASAKTAIDNLFT